MPGYDYAQPGAYFVTVCTKDRENLFGKVEADSVRLGPFGDVVADAWEWLAEQYGHVSIDERVVMPNHLHGILWLDESELLSRRRGGSRTAPTRRRKPLGRLIGAFKTVTTKQINALRGTPGVPVWQRNYYERVIRNEAELNTVRYYIQDNPRRWEDDPENPDAPRSGPAAVGAVREPPSPGDGNTSDNQEAYQ